MLSPESQSTAAPAKILFTALISLAAIYGIVCAALYFFQDDFLYPAAGSERQSTPPGWERMELAVEDAGDVEAFYKEPKADMGTILFLHGNGGGIADSVFATKLYANAGYGILVPEYPGYWGNPGQPSQKSLGQSAEAGMQWLESKSLQRSDVIVIGNSIGTGPAIEVAAKGARQLVTISGMTNLREVVAHRLKIVPTSLLKDYYQNEIAIAKVNSPVLVVHGVEDNLIPISHARPLANASGGDLVVSTGGHEIAYSQKVQQAILDWIISLSAEQ